MNDERKQHCTNTQKKAFIYQQNFVFIHFISMSNWEAGKQTGIRQVYILN